MVLESIKLTQRGISEVWINSLEVRRTHYKLLVEGCHYNKLDRQELGKWTTANQLILHEAVEQDLIRPSITIRTPIKHASPIRTMQRCSQLVKDNKLAWEKISAPDTDKIYCAQVYARVFITPARLAQNMQSFADNPCDRYRRSNDYILEHGPLRTNEMRVVGGKIHGCAPW